MTLARPLIKKFSRRKSENLVSGRWRKARRGISYRGFVAPLRRYSREANQQSRWDPRSLAARARVGVLARSDIDLIQEIEPLAI
jgi:hypothetical protein